MVAQYLTVVGLCIMDKSEEGGHSNKHRRSQEEEEDDSPKPFKKAKYAWQIKGRGRFRQSTTDPGCTSDRTYNTDETGSSTDNSADLQTQERDEVVKPQATIESPLEVVGSSPAKVGNMDNSERPPPPGHCMVVQCMGQFLTTLTPKNCTLRKWQTKQVAKGIIDNAINKVLEEMGFTPDDNENVNHHHNDVNHQNIENEGVSEAIRQRGLQRRRYHTQALWLPTAHAEHDANAPCTCWLYWKGGRGCSSTTPASPQPTTGKIIVAEPTNTKSVTDVNEASSYSDDDDDELQQPAAQHQDVMDAAVSFAINSKGLGMFSDHA